MPVIGHHHRTRLVIDETRVADNSSRDRLRELGAPGTLRDEATFAALGQESALDQDRGDFRQAQNRETGAFNPAAEANINPSFNSGT